MIGHSNKLYEDNCKGFIYLTSPTKNFSDQISHGPWFDSVRQKFLYISNKSFYWFDPLSTNAHDAKTFIIEINDLTSIFPIVTAKVSLDSQMLAIQKTSNEILVLSLLSPERWSFFIKHTDDNKILPPGIIWSEHGGKSQDLVILTTRGLELYKASLLRGQCKLSRAMGQRTTRYLYEPIHRVVLLTYPDKSVKSGLEVHGFFLRFDAFTDMPRIELPPPDKMPSLYLPVTKESDIFITQLYSSPYCIVHMHGASGSDDLGMYLLTKRGAQRTHNLSVPVTGSVRLTSLDNILYCHCIESRISVAYDIMASNIKNQVGILLDSPICGASMLSEPDIKSFPQGSIADEPYTGEWEVLQPSFFWDSSKRTVWVAQCNLEAVIQSIHEPKRLIPFLLRRGISSLRSSSFPTELTTSNINNEALIAKTLVIRKIYSSIIEKVGLQWLQVAFDEIISPYAEEYKFLQKLEKEESKTVESPKMHFKGHKVRYSLSPKSPNPSSNLSLASLENNLGLDRIICNDDNQFLPDKLIENSMEMNSTDNSASIIKGELILNDSLINTTNESIAVKRCSTTSNIIITQCEMLNYMWIPILKDSAISVNYYIWALEAYIAAIHAVSIKIDPYVLILLVKVMASQNKYYEIVKYLQMNFLSDSYKLAIELFKIAEKLKNKILNQKNSLIVNGNKIYGMLMNQFTEMLWRCDEKVHVVQWLLKSGYIPEAIELCSQSKERELWGSSIGFLNSQSISGLDFFDHSINAYNRPDLDCSFKERFFERLYLFLRDWDPSLFSNSSKHYSKSKLSETSCFPDGFFTNKILPYFNSIYGF